jgi:hypothetical protein
VLIHFSLNVNISCSLTKFRSRNAHFVVIAWLMARAGSERSQICALAKEGL